MPFGIPEVIPSFDKGPVRCSMPVIMPADPVQYFPVLQYLPVCLPDAHITIINMIGFRAASIKLKDQEIPAFFQVFDRSCFNIITSVIEFVSIMTELIKYIMKVLIDLVVQVGELRPAVMITRIGQIKYFVFRNYPVETVTVTVFHFFHPVFRPGMFF